MANVSFRQFTIISAIWVAFGVSNSALAGGDIYKRVVSKTNLSECLDGKLVEFLHTGGNVHGYFSSYALACLKNEKEAAWVLLSGTTCDDPSYNPKKCSTSRARAVPNFVATPNALGSGKSASGPVTAKFNLIKYGFGRNCHIIHQKYEVRYLPNPVNSEAWICDNIQVYDSTGSGDNPKAYKYFVLSTTGARPLEVASWAESPSSNADEAPELVTSFILPQSTYEYVFE